MTPVCVGLLGCGGMGLRHLRAYAHLASRNKPRGRLVAVHDLDPMRAEAAADHYSRLTGSDVEVVDRPERLFADPGIDAIDIVLPTYLHRTAAIQALSRSKPVLIAKPFALSVEDCDAILAAAPDPAMVAIAENFRHAPGSRAIAHAIRSGAVGAPLRMKLSNRIPPTDLMPAASSWYAQPEKAGDYLALELGVHEMDLQRAWFGPIRTISASRTGFETPVCSGELKASLFFADGSASSIVFELTARSSKPWRSRRTIRGPEGTIESRSWCGWQDGYIETADGRLSSAGYMRNNLASIFPDADERRCIADAGAFGQARPDDPVSYGVASVIQDFVSCIAENRRPSVDGIAGRAAVAASLAMLTAARTGIPVDPR